MNAALIRLTAHRIASESVLAMVELPEPQQIHVPQTGVLCVRIEEMLRIIHECAEARLMGLLAGSPQEEI